MVLFQVGRFERDNQLILMILQAWVVFLTLAVGKNFIALSLGHLRSQDSIACGFSLQRGTQWVCRGVGEFGLHSILASASANVLEE